MALWTVEHAFEIGAANFGFMASRGGGTWHFGWKSNFGDWECSASSLIHRMQDDRAYGWIDVTDKGSARIMQTGFWIEAQETPLGTRRWWFVCPHCGKRRRALYCPLGRLYFACRVCHDLAYASQQGVASVGRFAALLGAGPEFMLEASLLQDKDLYRAKKRHSRNAWRREKRKLAPTWEMGTFEVEE